MVATSRSLFAIRGGFNACSWVTVKRHAGRCDILQAVCDWLSQESTSRKQFLGRCLLARPDGVLPVSGDGQKEECRREAATQRECNYAASQKRVQSHAASVPPSSESKRHASHSQKAQNASLIS